MWVYIYINIKHHITERWSLEAAAEFCRNVGLDNSLLLQLVEPHLGSFQLIVLSEVLNIFRVYQILLCRIVSVELLKVVDLIFVLDVAMVS